MDMGLTNVRVTIVNPADESRMKETEMIVDTGSILTWVSEASLTEIGITRKWEKEFRTIEGHLVRRSTGIGIIRYKGVEGAVELVFGAAKDAQVLGITALEGLGFLVDPVTDELRHSSLLAL